MKNCMSSRFSFQDISLHILKLNPVFEGGTTILTNLNNTYPRTICVRYLRILFSSFGGEDF